MEQQCASCVVKEHIDHLNHGFTRLITNYMLAVGSEPVNNFFVDLETEASRDQSYLQVKFAQFQALRKIYT